MLTMRISTTKCLKGVAILVVCIVLYIFTQLHNQQYEFLKSSNFNVQHQGQPLSSVLHTLNKNNSSEYNEDRVGDLTDLAVRVIATRLNSEQNIRNLPEFGLKFNEKSVVLLVQVHDRVDTFRILVESLRNIRFIKESLVIFSHDFYSPEVFQIVQAIDFCPVMQIFYPYSVQIYNNSFPGNHPNDCPRNIDKSSAVKMKCNNALFPDRFNHYRTGLSCQLKHHWFWKLHFVFDRVTVLRGYEGTVLLLEDDYYLADDIIYFVRELKQLQQTDCRACKLFILGEYEKFSRVLFETAPQRATLHYFFIGIGRGMAISRAFWDELKSCKQDICTRDEYNWDFALHDAASACMKGGLKVMKSVASRVFHIGKCRGTHRHVRKCSTQAIVDNVRSFLVKYKDKLFPINVYVTGNWEKASKIAPMSAYGGWADPRDHHLCLSFFNNITESEQLLKDIHNNLLNKGSKS